MKIENRELQRFEQEWTGTLGRLRQMAPALCEIEYFFQTVAERFSLEKLSARKPKAIVKEFKGGAS